MLALLDTPGTVLAGRYALERELGRGGMATVYLARDERHQRLVAVKVLRPEVSASLGAGRFLREIEIAAHLTHPHILPLYDSGESDGTLYYVMPYVEGESLRARLAREVQLTLSDAIGIARDVGDAIAHAHAHGIVHRDIKPENILLEAGHAVVADFGIACAVATAVQGRVTDPGLAIGTPAYMSPEQASGEGVIDGRSDIYSLGCVLYEMLAGEPPFTGRSVPVVLARHRTDTPRSLRVVRPGVPAGVEAAIETALAKVPAERYATSHDLIRALEAAAASAAAPSRTTAPSRIRGSLALAVAGALALAAIVVRNHPRAVPGSVAIVVLPFEGERSEGGGREDARAPPHLVVAEALGRLPVLRPIDGGALLGASRGWRSIPLGALLRDAGRLGGKYLLAGTVVPGGREARVSVELYATGTGERVMRGDEPAPGGDLDEPLGRLALAAVSALAGREDLTLGPGGVLLSATSSATALGHLLQGQAHFWRGDLERSGDEFRAAIAADPGCGLAYLRLSVVAAWQFDYARALSTVEAALARRDRMAPRWINLLQAQRYLMLGYGDSAIAAFQAAVLDHRDDIDAWFGLGEALFHYGGLAGQSPLDARAALERVVRLDTVFAPVYDHLADLALYAGDARRAREYLDRMDPDDPARRAREVAEALRFGPRSSRAEALGRLGSIDRQAVSQLVALYMHHAFDPALADTIAGFLLGPERTPDDRRRGAEFRFAALASQGRWAEAVSAWDAAVPDVPFDAWVVQADLAGYPAAGLVGPMYAWAESLLAAGTIPDFSRPIWEDERQAFQALAQRAALAGDSAAVENLLRRIARAPAGSDAADPSRQALEHALGARLALLAGDTTGAIGRLRGAVARVMEPWTWYFPLTAMSPQRLLLADLLETRGAAREARRWRDSFDNSWAVGDALFAARLRQRAASRTPPPAAEE